MIGSDSVIEWVEVNTTQACALIDECYMWIRTPCVLTCDVWDNDDYVHLYGCGGCS